MGGNALVYYNVDGKITVISRILQNQNFMNSGSLAKRPNQFFN